MYPVDDLDDDDVRELADAIDPDWNHVPEALREAHGRPATVSGVLEDGTPSRSDWAAVVVVPSLFAQQKARDFGADSREQLAPMRAEENPLTKENP